MVTGTARAWVRRLDNRFLLWVAGGLPTLTTNLTRGPDRIVRFSNLRIAAPKLALAGNGLRRTRRHLHVFEGAGRHADYGPLRLTLEGRLERPRLAVRLERPADSLGLRDVLLNLEPNDAGFAWRGRGRLDARPVHRQWRHPAAARGSRRSSASTRSTSRARGRAARCAPIRRRLHRPARRRRRRARRAAAVRAVPRPPADRCRPHRQRGALRRAAADRDPARHDRGHRLARSGRHHDRGAARRARAEPRAAVDRQCRRAGEPARRHRPGAGADRRLARPRLHLQPGRRRRARTATG